MARGDRQALAAATEKTRKLAQRLKEAQARLARASAALRTARADMVRTMLFAERALAAASASTRLAEAAALRALGLGTAERTLHRDAHRAWLLRQLARFGSATAQHVGVSSPALSHWRKTLSITAADVARAAATPASETDREPIDYAQAYDAWHARWLADLASRQPDLEAAAIAAGVHPRTLLLWNRRLNLNLWSTNRHRRPAPPRRA